MKLFILLISCLLVACSSVNKPLQDAIAYGEIVELNTYSKEVDKQLLVRLFKSPVHKENCFKETYGICRYQYFLSVSTFDEFPETNIFPLDTQGVIKEIKWLDSDEIDTANFEFKILNYTDLAIKNNTDLVLIKSLLNVRISPSVIIESISDF